MKIVLEKTEKDKVLEIMEELGSRGVAYQRPLHTGGSHLLAIAG
jgi:hypothetical protein